MEDGRDADVYGRKRFGEVCGAARPVKWKEKDAKVGWHMFEVIEEGHGGKDFKVLDDRLGRLKTKLGV